MRSDQEKRHPQDNRPDEAAYVPQLSPELQSLAAGLAALVPTAPGIDRDRLMYEAGRAAVVLPTRSRHSAWLWPLSTAALALLSAGLSALLFSGSGVREQIVYVERAAARPAGSLQTAIGINNDTGQQDTPVAPQTVDPDGYLALRARVLAGGVDALPQIRSGDGSTFAPASSNPRQELEALLGS